MRVAQKICILGLFHWTKFSLKFVAIQKSLDFFVTPLFLMKKFCDPPSFFMAPPYPEENDSPLTNYLYPLQLGLSHMKLPTTWSFYTKYHKINKNK